MSMVDLSGVWRLRGEFIDVTAERFFEVASKQGGRYELHKEDKPKFMPSENGFVEAVVPCDVTTALIDGGYLKEPSLGTNTEDCMWIGDMSWWFIRDFEVTQEVLDYEEVRLFIETLDYKADIIINGAPAGRHKNAFRPFYDDVKRYLKLGANQLIIRLTTGYEEYYPHDSLSFYCNSEQYGQRIYLRKPQYTHGWGWCEPVPTCGIGGKIYLEPVSGARISRFRCDTIGITNDAAELDFVFEIENVSMCTADDAILTVELRYEGDIVHRFTKEIYAAGGINHVSERVVINSPKLWWPNGYGAQPLYTVTAYVECRGVRSSKLDKKIGIRTITLDHGKYDDGTRRFDFLVNGVKIFCKGGNWVPADSIYMRISDEKYEKLVKEAVECNFTMLRVWGGGLYEPDCFYEYCSKYGILVMQDFMYACAYYPDYLDWFMHEAAQEASYQTRRLAHQACMAVWTGNNEVHESYTDWFRGPFTPKRYYGTKIFNYLLPEIVVSNSPLIPYMPSSPFYGNKANDLLAGDCHLWNWTNKPHETGFEFMYELEAFDRIASKVRFSSEYGFHGALRFSSVAKFHDGEEVKFDGKIWKHHGEHKRKSKFIKKVLDRHLVDSSELNEKDYLEYSGIMQGILYEEMAVAVRRYAHCSGNLIWMYNDCWPETGWTVIDYYLTRKISFYFMKRAYEPQKLIVRVINGNVSMVVINETPQAASMTLEYGYMDFNGNTATEDVHVKEITVEPHGRLELTSFPAVHSLDTGFYYMCCTDGMDGFLPATSVRGYYREVKLPRAEIKAEYTANGNDTVVTLCSDAFSPIVSIQSDDDTIKMSDNYFQLLPRVKKVVTIYNFTETDKSKLEFKNILGGR